MHFPKQWLLPVFLILRRGNVFGQNKANTLHYIVCAIMLKVVVGDRTHDHPGYGVIRPTTAPPTSNTCTYYTARHNNWHRQGKYSEPSLRNGKIVVEK